MAKRVELEFRRAADRLIAEDQRLLVAVSGGGDSMALLHLLHRYRRGRGLVVAHLDHALRDGSADDRRFVEGAAAELGLECVSDRRPVGDWRGADESPQEAARGVRRAFLLETAEDVRAERIVTAHTLDDQAETILMRLARGVGPSALSGIAERGPGPFVRPLLEIERAELRAFLARRGLPFRDDPSNHDLRFDRNRVRRVIVPLLAETLNPRAARHVVDAAQRLREDAALLDRMAIEAYDRFRVGRRDRHVELDPATVAEMPLPLARRLVRLALRDAGCDLRRVGSKHIEAVLELARGGSGKRLDLPNQRSAWRQRGRLVLGR